MAILIKTPDPEHLLSKLTTDIRGGKIPSWLLDQKSDLTPTCEETRYRVWFLPKSGVGLLTFSIFGHPEKEDGNRIYAKTHASLVDMLLEHYSLHFADALVTKRGQSPSDLF